MNDPLEIRDSTPRGFLSVADAATALGVSYRTVTRWCAGGLVAGARKQRSSGREGFRWIVPARFVRKAAG